jgi:hypothetical protein
VFHEQDWLTPKYCVARAVQERYWTWSMRPRFYSDWNFKVKFHRVRTTEELNSHDKYFFISGIDVGLDRWQKVYQTWEPHFNDHILSFNDAHLMMALVGKYFQIWKCCRLQANLKLTRFETT